MMFRFEDLSADFKISQTRIVGRLCGLAMSSDIPFRYMLDTFEVYARPVKKDARDLSMYNL